MSNRKEFLPPGMTQANVLIDEQLWHRFRQIARERELTAQAVVGMLVEDYVSDNDPGQRRRHLATHKE